MMKRTLLTVVVGLTVTSVGCAGRALDGGSSEGTNAQGAAADETGADLATTPLAGTIAGRAFEPRAIDVHYAQREGQWVLSIDNYDNDCGTMKSRPDPKTAMTVNIGALEPNAGATKIAYGDAHGATFQVGVYETTAEAATYPVTRGTLRFDEWDETPGATIRGALELVSDEGTLEGTFVAKVCAAR